MSGGKKRGGIEPSAARLSFFWNSQYKKDIGLKSRRKKREKVRSREETVEEKSGRGQKPEGGASESTSEAVSNLSFSSISLLFQERDELKTRTI